MEFKEAIKINGKATLGCGGYVMFNDENILVDNLGVGQIFNKEYLVSTDWEPFNEEIILSKEIISHPSIHNFVTLWNSGEWENTNKISRNNDTAVKLFYVKKYTRDVAIIQEVASEIREKLSIKHTGMRLFQTLLLEKLNIIKK